jgi:hypothetical protein
MTFKHNCGLHELLREWRLESTPLPRRFVEQVWERIRRNPILEKSIMRHRATKMKGTLP